MGGGVAYICGVGLALTWGGGGGFPFGILQYLT